MTERTAVLVEVATALESLRQSSPMNGEGSNLMLTNSLNAVVRLAGDDWGVVLDAVTAVRDHRAAEDLARYRRLLLETPPTA